MASGTIPQPPVKVFEYTDSFTLTANGLKTYASVSVPGAKFVIPYAKNNSHKIHGAAEGSNGSFDIYFRNLTSENSVISNGYKLIAIY